MHYLLIKNWLPIASYNGQSKFNLKDLETIKPRKTIYIPCPRTNASLLGLRRNKGTETNVCWLHYSIKYAHLQFFPEVTPQSAFTLMLIFCCGTTTLLTWYVCINDSAASMSNFKTCSGSKPCTLGQEALVPKFLDELHVCMKTFRETPGSIRCDCFFVWKVRNIYMNSMNIQIHVLIEFWFHILIEFTCL
jgi:hypothetical protein